MAILAADSARYRRYLRGVRSEYSHCDDEAFRTGRTTFLRSILGRERVFLSEQALKLWEEPARANLRAELSEWAQDPQGLLQALRPSRIHLKHIPPRMRPHRCALGGIFVESLGSHISGTQKAPTPCGVGAFLKYVGLDPASMR